MSEKVLLFLTDGFEEIEALSVVDILRRANIDVATLSLTGEIMVTGSQDISVRADSLYEDADKNADMIIFPGGPGTANYKTYSELIELTKKFHEEEKYIAAICAAPTFLAELGILKGKTAVCYPTLEKQLANSFLGKNTVEVDGKIITSKGPATSLLFALKIVEILKGKEAEEIISDKLLIHML